MELKDKLIEALMQPLQSEYIRIEDEDGITGFVISPKFRNISSLDRQGMIEEALKNAAKPLSSSEKRRVLMIAALTPEEYNAVGAKIRIHRVREIANGVEVLLHGGISDAEYVRGVLKKLEGIKTTEPKQSPGAVGILMLFRALASKESPLTKGKVIRILSNDPYIQVMPNA